MTEKAYTQLTQELFEEKNIPIEFQQSLLSQAYDRGHSWGYDECLGILIGLVNEAEMPIKAYTKRILEETQ